MITTPCNDKKDGSVKVCSAFVTVYLNSLADTKPLPCACSNANCLVYEKIKQNVKQEEKQQNDPSRIKSSL